MTDQHPIITPPPELIDKWDNLPLSTREIISIAWQHGADTELKACCEWVAEESPVASEELRAARRPKPPSLKEQALIALDDADLDAAHENILRRALEALPDG